MSQLATILGAGTYQMSHLVAILGVYYLYDGGLGGGCGAQLGDGRATDRTNIFQQFLVVRIITEHELSFGPLRLFLILHPICVPETTT